MVGLYKLKPVPQDCSDFKKLDKIWKENWAQLKRQDEEAKKKGTIIGGFLTEPIADGKAIYQIVRETKVQVLIKVCTGLGDDWVIPYWGEKAVIDKEYAIQSIRRGDGLNQIFKRRSD
ncbi:MAG: hypothetical protein Q8O10_10290 [candidate division Zixibacteria bacterium]|nr:hypothetical protein [candidate division Zixibacteria bacterium]